MGNLNEQILAQTQTLHIFGLQQIVPGHAVVVEQVAADPGALGLPVQPDAAGAVVEVVAPDDYVDGRVELDAADLGARQIPLVVDVVDVVVLNDGEDAAQVAHDAGLAAVVDVAAPDGVGADGLFAPAVDLGDEGAVPLGLGAVLVFVVGPLVVVALLQVLAQGDAGALGMGDLAVLNDPALGPVGADHAVLQSRGRRPLGGGLGDHEAGEGDVVHMLRSGVEAVGPQGDFHHFLVGILALEVGVEDGFLAVFGLGGVPGVLGEFPVPGAVVEPGVQNLFQGVLLIQGFVVQEHLAGVAGDALIQPVAVDQGGIGVVMMEDFVGEGKLPDVAFKVLPILEPLGAGDGGTSGHGGTVDNGCQPGACVGGADFLPVDAGCHQHLVSGHGHGGCLADGSEGLPGGAVANAPGTAVNIQNHGITSCWMNWAVFTGNTLRKNAACILRRIALL